MPLAVPQFWSKPILYFRYHAHQNPALFWSVVVGSAGPVVFLTVPSIRSALGYQKAPKIPLTYPIPPGPRVIPEGYDD